MMTAFANSTLPPLSSILSDDQLNEYIRRDRRVIPNARENASKLYERFVLANCPQYEMQAKWRNFQSQIVNGRRRGLDAEELRVSLAAMECMLAYVARWNSTSYEEKNDIWRNDPNYAYQLPTAATVFHDPNDMPVAFNVGNFIGDLTKRSIRIDTVDGNITAIPDEKLTTQDVALIKLHKAAIIEVLLSAKVVA